MGTYRPRRKGGMVKRHSERNFFNEQGKDYCFLEKVSGGGLFFIENKRSVRMAIYRILLM